MTGTVEMGGVSSFNGTAQSPRNSLDCDLEGEGVSKLNADASEVCEM